MKKYLNAPTKLVFKAILVICFLLLAGKDSMAQTPYAQLSFAYSYSSSYGAGYWYDHYTVNVNFYSDADCTIPSNVGEPLYINFSYISTDDCGVPQVWDYTDSPAQLESNFYGEPGYFTQPTIKTAVRYDLRPGSGYIVAPVSTVDAPSDCY